MTVLDQRRPADLGFMAGGGEMGALMRALDWPATPLGPAERWPQPLKTSVSTCLECAFPILLWWGPELVMLYNDEYRPILGDSKHPRALGAPGRAVWPEIWDVIGPMLDQVMQEGRATRSRDQRLVIDRSGHGEEAWFTFSFSPVRDESGSVAGVFCPVVETTGRVLAERRLRVLTDLEAAAASARTRSVAEAQALCLAALERDCPDVPFALLYALDGGVARLEGSAGAPAGGFAPETLPAEGGVWPLGAVQRGEPALVELDPDVGPAPASAAGPPVERALVLPARRGPAGPGAALVLGINPLRALDEDYRSFLDRVADATASAMANARALEVERGRRLSDHEQRARDSVFRAVADHAPAIIWLSDADGRTAWLSRGWRELTGQAPDHPPHEAWFAAAHPEDAPRVRALFRKASAERAAFRTEYRLRRPDGDDVWVLDVARPRIAEDGRYLGHIGAIMDIDDRRRAEQHRTLLIDELNHRVKNTLSIVQAIAQQSLRGDAAPSPALTAFEGRLGALAAAHGLLTSLNWESAALEDIVRAAVRPVCGERDARLNVAAGLVRIRPKQAVSIAIALHELATNALKYGALSAEEGRVEIDWEVGAGCRDGNPNMLRFSWTESGGPAVSPPARRGFGSRLIERALAAELGGAASLDFRPEGLVCRIEAPLSEGVDT